MNVTYALVTTCTSLVGQAALATDSRLTDWLCRNPHLCDDVWLSLWGKHPSLERALELVAHPLNSARIDRILSRERRITVIGEVLRYSELSEAQGRLVLDQPKLFPRLAGMWASSGLAPAALVGEVTADLQPRFYLRSRHLFDQDEMLAALDAPLSDYERGSAAVELLLHPNAGVDVQRKAFAVFNSLPPLTASSPRVFMPDAARERRRYSFALTRPWEDADLPEELDILSRLRSLDQLPAPARSRVVAFEAERDAKTLPPVQVGPPPGASSSSIIGAITRAVGPAPVRPVRTAGDVPLDSETETIAVVLEVAKMVSDLLDAQGADAWAVAVPLIADGYSGTAADLAATVMSLSVPPPRPVRVPITAQPQRTTRDRH